MKTRLSLYIPLLVGLVVAIGPKLHAHHGSAAYDNKVVEYKTATVTRFSWNNPHALVYFDVGDKDGVAHWIAELGSPTNISVLGWTRNSLHAGDVVTVYLWPAKSGKTVGRMNRVVFSDGKTLRDSQLGGGDGEGGTK